MINFTRYIAYATILLLAVISCKRQPICRHNEHTSAARVGVLIDWSQSNIEPDQIDNISIYAYSQSESTPYTKVSGDIYSSYIALPVGEYSIIVFNNFAGNIQGVDFNNSDNFKLFSAESIAENSSSGVYYTPLDSEFLAQEVEKMAVWRVEGVEITPDIVSCSYCQREDFIATDIEINAIPTPLTTECTVELLINNLNNAAYIEVNIIGLARGANFSTEERFLTSSLAPVYSLNLTDIEFSSSTNGIALGSITTFGKTDDTSLSYQALIEIILNSGEKLSFSRDITEQILAQDNTELYISLTSDEYAITLPESGGNGFGVENWGDNEQIEIL